MNQEELGPDLEPAAHEDEVADDILPDFLLDSRFAMGKHAVLERFQFFEKDPTDPEQSLLIAVRYHGEKAISCTEHKLSREQFEKIKDAKGGLDHGARLARWWGRVKFDMSLQIVSLDARRQIDAAKIDADIHAQSRRRSSRPSRPV